MRFTDDTADIPDRLIALQEKGEVVFLCGAGISQRYGLPSFYRLTTAVYQTLGETWIGHPAEEDAMGLDAAGEGKGPPALDRALFALSKRLRGQDNASRLRAERLITEAVERHLEAPAGPFAAHADVWTLSRDAEMRERVVTTNFDTLFERAAPGATPSRAGADLPPPLGTDFTGVLHLHGRIADSGLGLKRSALVLNSAEFGEAYLRSGWAARYVYDLARASTIVILGYGADDPPMRYILEVLTADRERYPDIREIFAFVPCAPNGAARDRTRAIWDAKGATALPYDSSNQQDHDALYKSIADWAGFAADPTGWRRSAARRILGQPSEDVGEGDWERLRWLLGGGDADELLADINPGPDWVASLAKADMFKAGGVSPHRWIQQRLNDRSMPAAVVEHVPITDEVLLSLERSLVFRNRKPEDLHPVLAQAWRLIVQSARKRRSSGGATGLEWHRCISAIEDGDMSLATKQDVLACLRPSMSLGQILRWPGLDLEQGDDEQLQLRHVLRISWGPRPLDKIEKLVGLWPSELRGDLIRSLIHALGEGLEEAQDTQTLHHASSDVKSVSAHPQDNYSDGFYPIVRATMDLWDAHVPHDPDNARSTALAFLTSPYLLLKRMGLHALRQPLFSDAEASDAIVALSDEEFWLTDCRRETMQLFVHRWPTMAAVDRERVEARIVSGMPRELLISDGDETQIASVRDNAVFIRLARIEGAGQSLSDAAAEALAHLRATHPDWLAEDEQDDFRVWSSGTRMVGRQGDISVLAGTKPDKILERVEEVAAGNPFDQGDLWRLYCDAEPAIALVALRSDDPTGTLRSGAWQSFFWAITSSEDLELQAAALEAILDPVFAFKPYTAIADWVLRTRSTLPLDTDRFLAVWDRLFAAIQRDGAPVQDQSRTDVVSSMLNSADGMIGKLLVDEFSRLSGDRHESDRAKILHRMEAIISAPGDLGWLGSAALMDRLQQLHDEATEWTTIHLLPQTRWTSPFAPAAWSVLISENVPSRSLFSAIKADLLEAGLHDELDRSVGAVASWLIAPLLWAQEPVGPIYDISAIEVRKALARSVEDVRNTAAFWLSEAIAKLPGDEATVWRERLGPLFREVWPIEPSSRSRTATIHLVRLALQTKNAFSDAVEAIAPALSPLDPWDIETWLGREDDAKAFYASEPWALLALFDAVVEVDGVPRGLLAMLEALAGSDGRMATDRRYLKLLGWARRAAAP